LKLGEGNCIKLDIPLSATLSVLVFFDGGIPDAVAFTRLREALAVVERSLVSVPEKPIPVSEPLKPRKPPKPRKLRELGPCLKHPEAARHATTNRCVRCLAEFGDRLRRGQITA